MQQLQRQPSSVWIFWKNSRNKWLLHLSECAMTYAIKSSNLVFCPRLILMKFHYVQLFGVTEMLPFGSAIKCHLRTWIEIEFLVHFVILLFFWSKFTFFKSLAQVIHHPFVKFVIFPRPGNTSDQEFKHEYRKSIGFEFYVDFSTLSVFIGVWSTLFCSGLCLYLFYLECYIVGSQTI